MGEVWLATACLACSACGVCAVCLACLAWSRGLSPLAPLLVAWLAWPSKSVSCDGAVLLNRGPAAGLTSGMMLQGR